MAQFYNVQLNYELKSFKGEAAKPFNASSRIIVNFAESHYAIEISGMSGENRLYRQLISESERKDLLRPALENLFAEIKKQSGENPS